MPPLDFVKYGSRSSKQEFGLELYHMPDNNEKIPKHNPHSKIFPGKKTTYVDEHMKSKKDIPYKFYETGLNLLDKGKSKMCKAARKTFADDIKDF